MAPTAWKDFWLLIWSIPTLLVGILLTACGVVVLLAGPPVAVGSIAKGWVLTILWRWFVVPIFDLPELHLAAAVGLSLIVTLVASRHDMSFTQGQVEKIGIWAFMGKSMSLAGLSPLLVLLVGWLVHLFM